MKTENFELSLKLGFEYFKKIRTRDPEYEQCIQPGDFFSSGKNINRSMFGFFVDCTLNNGFPKILTDEEYRHLNAPELYHGFAKNNYGVEVLSHWKYHYGTGFINGMFFSFSPEVAYGYTIAITGSNPGMRNRERVLKAKIDSNNGIEYSTIKYYSELLKNYDLVESDLENESKLFKIQKFINQQEDSELANEYLDTIIKPSTLAVLLGYDYVNALGNIVVLSRQCMSVSETMYNMFMAREMER